MLLEVSSWQHTERGDGKLVLSAVWPKAMLETVPQLQFSLHPSHGIMLESILD